MGIASIALAMSIISSSTFILIFPICQIVFAQDNATQSVVPSSSLDTIIAGIVSGGAIGAAATLIGTYLNNRHNMDIKKQELEHGLSIELLKHRIDCYAIIIKYTISTLATIDPENFSYDKIGEIRNRALDWANEEKGGLLMSGNSLRLYNAFMRTLADLRLKAREEKGDNPAAYKFSETHVKETLRAEWDFRMSLLGDIGVHGEIPRS
jgi:hypothetical protein